MTQLSSELLLQHAASKKHHPVTKPKVPLLLSQGNCAFINTSGIPKGGNIDINFPGCTTVTLYQAFLSPQAQEVWIANQNLKPHAPLNEKTSGLMVVKDYTNTVELMIPYQIGLQLKLSNNQFNDRLSEYLMSGDVPGYNNGLFYFRLLSPDITVEIPAPINGGLATNCMVLQQKSSLRIS